MKLTTIASAVALLGLHMAATAQSADVQRVEITGSSIKRVQSEGALPIQVISRQEIDRQGLVTAEQLINRLSANGNGLDNLASNADVVDGAARGNNGASAANLRGQGAASTLVLLNGRRVAAHGLNGGVVDLNSIPMAAVDRIEILRDGASAIYGTDAIGGVINFILRKNYNGLQAEAFTDITEQGGGNIFRTSLTGGFGNLDSDKFNVLFTLARSENKALRGDQRSFVNTFQPDRGLSVDTRGTPFATVFAIGSLYNGLSLNNTNATGRGTGPVLPGGGTQVYNGINVLDLPGQPGCSSIDGMAAYDEVLWATPAARFGCAWDTGRAAVLQQPITNTNLVGRGTLQLGEHQLVAELVAGRAESKKSFSPNQLSSSATASNPLFNLSYPSSGTSYNYVFNALVGAFPTLAANRGQPLAMRWRCMPCGNREVETTSDTMRLLLAADGPLPWLSGWDYRAGVSSASSQTDSLLGSGYYYSVPLAASINSGLLNPFLLPGQSQTAAGLDALAAASAKGVKLYGGKFTLTQADITASGPIAKLPAGDAMMAVGADVRTEKYRFNGDERDLANQRAILNAPFDNINALGGVERKIKAVYTELLLPITKQLELTAAVRHDDYTGFGGTTNPKLALRFAPLDSLVVRGSASRGFRVPTFNQLYNGVTVSTYAGKDLVDPLKCPSGVVNPAVAGCESVTPEILFGGKPDLGPEKSKQWTAGFVWAPSDNLAINMDWWDIRKVGTIQSFGTQVIAANYALFPNNFLYDSTGKLTGIDARWVNAGETITRGIDFGLRGSGKAGAGRWVAGLDGTYLLEKKSRLVASAPFGASEVGQFTRAGDLGLRWKHTASFTYSEGNWSGTVSQQYSSGYVDAVLPGVANGTVKPVNWSARVAPYEIFNASVTYSGIKNLDLSFGIKNLLNEDPPFSAAYDSNTGAGSSWEPRVADPRGRSFSLRLNYKFF